MISDLDTYRAANVLIREHGEDAAIEAAMYADTMLEYPLFQGYPDRLFERRRPWAHGTVPMDVKAEVIKKVRLEG